MNQPTHDFTTTTLQELDAGLFASKVNHALAQCALGVVEHGRKGEVVITLKMQRIGESHQIQLEHKLAFKAPTRRGRRTEEDTTATPLHVNKGGALTVMPDTQGVLFDKTTGEVLRG